MPKKISFLSCSVLVIFICVIAYTSNAYPNESIDSTQNDLENIQQKINSLDKQIIQKTKAQKGITRELKQEEKNAAKKKADEAKKEKNRTAAIQDVKKEILFLGETPMPEYEFTSEDKYIAALRKQIDEIKKLKEEEEYKKWLAEQSTYAENL